MSQCLTVMLHNMTIHQIPQTLVLRPPPFDLRPSSFDKFRSFPIKFDT